MLLPPFPAQLDIAGFRADTEQMRSEIRELKTSAKIFQGRKCASCGGELELPSIHFLCMHSFCANCVPEGEREVRV